VFQAFPLFVVLIVYNFYFVKLVALFSTTQQWSAAGQKCGKAESGKETKKGRCEGCDYSAQTSS
jgi:hypothetical protein